MASKKVAEGQVGGPVRAVHNTSSGSIESESALSGVPSLSSTSSGDVSSGVSETIRQSYPPGLQPGQMADWFDSPPPVLQDYLTDSQEEVLDSGWNLMISQQIATNRIQELAAESLNGGAPGGSNRALLSASPQDELLVPEDLDEGHESRDATLDKSLKGEREGTGDVQISQGETGFHGLALGAFNRAEDLRSEVWSPSQNGGLQSAEPGATFTNEPDVLETQTASEAPVSPAANHAATRGIPPAALNRAVLASPSGCAVTSAAAPGSVCEIEECEPEEPMLPAAIPGVVAPTAIPYLAKTESVLGDNPQAPVQPKLRVTRVSSPQIRRPAVLRSTLPAKLSPGSIPRAPAPAHRESGNLPEINTRASPEPRQLSFVEDEFARQKALFEATLLRRSAVAPTYTYTRWASFALMGAAVARAGGYILLASAAHD
ncbi:hypothetical protein KFL_000110380 [Klebsormidium nitens]|uniref:Uncharacterized protein n=1 Tax=Klebsormidium nitens TaxID=105231 RepID=A0A1Y1HMW9_KLENI|nr:hypothetical protein KFL_000110380 [Klebsormidium nitens]|eukprot:GAQ78341.1 hypothetical protein KFL_000110380 [Klebsormidium nitens]